MHTFIREVVLCSKTFEKKYAKVCEKDAPYQNWPARGSQHNDVGAGLYRKVASAPDFGDNVLNIGLVTILVFKKE